MRRILFAIHLDSFFTGLFGIVGRLQHTHEYEPLLLFARRYGSVARDIQRCRDQGARVLGDSDEQSAEQPTFTRSARSLPGEVRRAVGRRLSPEAQKAILESLPMQLVSLARRIRGIREIIRRERITLLVLGGDIVHYDTSAFIKAAHQERIPAVVIAGWMIHQDENAEAFFFDAAIQLDRWQNRVASRLYPSWVYQYRGRGLVRLPAGGFLAREWLGLAPPRPWTLHSGRADAIAVESDATRDACLREGLPADQIIVTGSINHDTMTQRLAEARRWRVEIAAELGLGDPERPWLLSGLPPNELRRAGGRPECDFSRYEELVEFWVKTVAAARGWSVIISLHPSLLYEDLQHIEQWGVRISRRHTAELIALCDVYVASVSTTIQWAAACGKPVINYDVYRYRQHDYAEIGGLVAMEEQREFQTAVAKLTGDRAYYAELSAKQAACKERWGRLDGHAGDRIVELFGSLVSRYEEAAP